jgi:hypothetical protein
VDVGDERPIELREGIGAEGADCLQATAGLVDEAADIDAQAAWPERLQESDAGGEECDCPFVVRSEEVVEASGHLDDALIEVRQIRLILPPEVLKGLVAIVEAPGVELADAIREGLGVSADVANGHA